MLNNQGDHNFSTTYVCELPRVVTRRFMISWAELLSKLDPFGSRESPCTKHIYKHTKQKKSNWSKVVAVIGAVFSNDGLAQSKPSNYHPLTRRKRQEQQKRRQKWQQQKNTKRRKEENQQLPAIIAHLKKKHNLEKFEGYALTLSVIYVRLHSLVSAHIEPNSLSLKLSIHLPLTSHLSLSLSIAIPSVQLRLKATKDFVAPVPSTNPPITCSDPHIMISISRYSYGSPTFDDQIPRTGTVSILGFHAMVTIITKSPPTAAFNEKGGR